VAANWSTPTQWALCCIKAALGRPTLHPLSLTKRSPPNKSTASGAAAAFAAQRSGLSWLFEDLPHLTRQDSYDGIAAQQPLSHSALPPAAAHNDASAVLLSP